MQIQSMLINTDLINVAQYRSDQYRFDQCWSIQIRSMLINPDSINTDTINADQSRSDQYECIAANGKTSLPTCRCKPSPALAALTFACKCAPLRYILCVVKWKTWPSKFIVSLFLYHVVQQLGSQLVNFDQTQSCTVNFFTKSGKWSVLAWHIKHGCHQYHSQSDYRSNNYQWSTPFLRLPGTCAAIIDENQTPLARFPQ